MTVSPSQAKKTKNKDDEFKFTPDNMAIAERYIAKYPEGRQASAVLPLLDLAQRQCEGWLPQAAIEEVACILSMPPIRVYEVASFYTMFNLKPVGKYHVQICGTTPCWLRGAGEIRTACEKRLNIKTGQGQITSDGFFSLSEVECLGACVNAPIVQINDDYYEDLTPESVIGIIDALSTGKEPKVGSAVGRQTSAPQNMILEPIKTPVKRIARKKTEDAKDAE
jgi:NADH-quinone oxidoreductase subunit E